MTASEHPFSMRGVLKKPLTNDRERLFPYPQRPESQLRISLASLSPAISRIQSTKSKGLDTVYTPLRMHDYSAA